MSSALNKCIVMALVLSLMTINMTYFVKDTNINAITDQDTPCPKQDNCDKIASTPLYVTVLLFLW